MEKNIADHMKFCPHCAEAVPKEALICPFCGFRFGMAPTENIEFQRLKIVLAACYGVFAVSIVGIIVTMLLG